MDMERFFSLRMPISHFVRNTALFTIATLVPMLVLYVASRPGFGAMLLDGGPALSRFLRQVVTNGFPVVFTVNYISFFLFAWLTASKKSRWDSSVLLFCDVLARLVTFFLLHAVIYVLSADWFDAFGGDRMTALRVVAPTLARSALFDNVSGAYLYATLVSALPLYVAAIERSAWLGRLAHNLAGRPGSLVLALALFAVNVLLLTVCARSIVGLQ